MTHSKGKQAVFLDRDGVINEVVFRNGQPGSPRLLDEFRLCDGIRETLKELAAAGVRLFVVTNQPDVARGFLDPVVLDEMTRAVLELLPIERVLTCAHDDSHECLCRKPKPGLLLQVALSEGIDLSRSFLIGDSSRDVQAGRSVGCKTILLRRDYNQGVKADYSIETVSQAVDLILGELQHDG